MTDEITYRVDFVLRLGIDGAERRRFERDVLSIDIHPERIEVGPDGRGSVIYTDPPIDPEERLELTRWLAGSATVESFTEVVAPTPGLTYRFTCAAAPVQAEGSVAGHPLYFRARWDEWSFAVSERPGVDPVMIDSPESAESDGWFRGGRLTEAYEGSYLELSQAAVLIQICAREYLDEHPPANQSLHPTVSPDDRPVG